MKSKKLNRLTKNQAKKDIYWLCAFPLLAAIITLSTNINFLISTFLFFGIPAIYLSIRTKHAVLRTLIFASLVSCVYPAVEYFGGVDNSWFVPSIFPRLFNHIAIEDIIWGFLLTYLVIIFYEHFFDKGRHRVTGKSLKFLVLTLAGVVAVFTALYALNPSNLDYFYLKVGLLVLVIPLGAFLFVFPKYLTVLLKVTVYFFSLNMIVAMISIHKGFWYYPGENFIGWVSIGSIRFPIEELLFWITLFSSSAIVYFEFFDDNNARLPQRTLKKIKSYAK